jgi:CRISPR type III-A-associated protein Csm2
MGNCRTCGKPALPGQDYCMMCSPKKVQTNPRALSNSQGRSGRLGDITFSSFYSDQEKKQIRESIFLSKAREAAQIFYHDRMSKGQLREFLRYLKALEIPLRMPGSGGFQALEADINELFTFAIYQANREKEAYPKSFVSFFEAHRNLISDDQREFEAFVKYVSSILAYFMEIEFEKKMEYRRNRKRQFKGGMSDEA